MVENYQNIPITYSRYIQEKDGFSISVPIRGTSMIPGTGGSAFSITSAFGIFFIANHSCSLIWVAEAHSVAGDGNFKVMKYSGGVGQNLLVSNFSVTGATYTSTTKSKSDLNLQYCDLKNGDLIVLENNNITTKTFNGLVTAYFKYNNNGNYR